MIKQIFHLGIYDLVQRQENKHYENEFINEINEIVKEKEIIKAEIEMAKEEEDINEIVKEKERIKAEIKMAKEEEDKSKTNLFHHFVKEKERIKAAKEDEDKRKTNLFRQFIFSQYGGVKDTTHIEICT